MFDRNEIPAFLRPFRAGKLFVGFSGGCDSTALLLLLRRWGWTGERLEAVHFDHGLRGERSRREAERCEKFCAARGIAFRKIELHLAPGPGLEERARQARLDAWRSLGEVAVALGHHADDAAETLLLRLARGSASGGLAGLRPVRKFGKVAFLRPLLEYRRSELEDFLRAEGVTEWVEDDSNSDNALARNYLRNVLLPGWYAANPACRAGLRQSLKVLALDADFLEASAAEKLRELPAGWVSDAAFWRDLHPALLGPVLRGYLGGRLGEVPALPHAALERFRKELAAAHRRRCTFTAGRGVKFILTGDRLELLSGESEAPQDEVVWDPRRVPVLEYGSWRLACARGRDAAPAPDAYCFVFDAAEFPETVAVGPRRAGEVLELLEGGTRRIKHLLANASLPVAPVILRDGAGRVLAVPGVRRGAAAPVTAATRERVCISAVIVTKTGKKRGNIGSAD